jgi:uncharacterized protein involved in response to NO
VLRALAALASTQLAWSCGVSRPARPAVGRCGLRLRVALGFTLAALLPLQRVEAWHLAFVGGYALLTLGIGTRVVVSHGGHAMGDEGAVLSWLVVAALVAAALVRSLGPALDPTRATLHHAIAAALATLAFGAWIAGAAPRLRRTRPALLRVEGTT